MAEGVVCVCVQECVFVQGGCVQGCAHPTSGPRGTHPKTQRHTSPDPEAHPLGPRGRHPLREQTDTGENITLPQTSFTGGNYTGKQTKFVDLNLVAITLY